MYLDTVLNDVWLSPSAYDSTALTSFWACDQWPHMRQQTTTSLFFSGVGLCNCECGQWLPYRRSALSLARKKRASALLRWRHRYKRLTWRHRRPWKRLRALDTAIASEPDIWCGHIFCQFLSKWQFRTNFELGFSPPYPGYWYLVTQNICKISLLLFSNCEWFCTLRCN